ncbi:MAG: hypothetical protein KJP07_23305 [Desulfatitalea sp.]|nr:hypothetical protein [Desulfatitalea sp.]
MKKNGLYQKGDRIRLLSPLVFSGWIGNGTVDRDQLWLGQTVHFRRDGYEDKDWEVCEACIDEVELLSK